MQVPPQSLTTDGQYASSSSSMLATGQQQLQQQFQTAVAGPAFQSAQQSVVGPCVQLALNQVMYGNQLPVNSNNNGEPAHFCGSASKSFRFAGPALTLT